MLFTLQLLASILYGKTTNFTAEAREAQQYLDDMKTVKGNVQPTAVTEEATNEDDIVWGD